MSQGRAEFAVTVRNDGTLALDDPGRFLRWKERNPGHRYVMVFEDEEDWRSNQQNRRLRWLEKLFSEDTGYTPQEVHLEMLKRFASYEVRNGDGSVEKRIRHTRHMSKRQMAEHLELVEHFIVEQGTRIPERPRAVA